MIDNPTLFVAAHPDDIETMMGYRLMTQGRGSATTLVATDGEESPANHTGDSSFVINGGRRQESLRGLSVLGVPATKQLYLGLPDGGVAGQQNRLQSSIVKNVLDAGVGTIITLGADGYDGHPDHIAVHDAVQQALARIRQMGAVANLLTLNSSYDGIEVIKSSVCTKYRKIGAMSCHASQFDMAYDPEHLFSGAFDEDSECLPQAFMSLMRAYLRLILTAETYDRNC